MSSSTDKITYFARTNARPGHFRRFGIRAKDRLQHLYVIGKTGTGKTALLQNMITQDLASEGLCVLDPHGDLIERVRKAVPDHRRDDLIYLDAANPLFGYNPLKNIPRDKRPLAVSAILETFEKLWDKRSWGSRLQYILRCCLIALLDHHEETHLDDILRLFQDKDYRKAVAAHVSNKEVRNFWLYEYPSYSRRYASESIAPIQSKIVSFLSYPNVRTILINPKKQFSFRRMMDEGKILLVDLAVGKIGSDAASLIGGLLVSTIALAGLSRAEVPEQERRDFYVFMDEFQMFTTRMITLMYPMLRKYHVSMTVAHQYMSQLDDEVRDAVIANAGTLISFRLGGRDAPFIAREFAPKFETVDLLNLPNYHIYAKLMIDGTPSQPFSATTLAPWELPQIGKGEKIERGVPLKSVRDYL